MHLALGLSLVAALLPPPVQVRQEPEGVTLDDPSFEALPGARADYGRLGGSVYEIEVPDNWNGRLVLHMHGYGEFAASTGVSPPGIRRYLIGHGYAWGASSFSGTSLIPGRAADETAAVWDLFARRYGRPARTYVTGQSMGGAATNVAAERYGNRFDGALALCGAASQTPAARIDTDFFVAGAYAAGVTQRDYDRSRSAADLIDHRIRPALLDPRRHRRFVDIMISLSGGPRPFAREGFLAEEETNWQRAELQVASRIAANRHTRYHLGPPSPVTSREFNRAAIRLRTNAALRRAFLAGNEMHGQLAMPLLTLHSTGDGQVPIGQLGLLRRLVRAAGKQRLLASRVFTDPGHCGFTYSEWATALAALVRWVEHGVRPRENDPRRLRPRFELSPRPGTRAANQVPGARGRVKVSGRFSLDGAPFDARFLGAVVVRDGLVTPCQLELGLIRRGRGSVTAMARPEAAGCGGAGSRVALWTFAKGRILFSRSSWPWPRAGRLSVRGAFASRRPNGTVGARAGFSGSAYTTRGRELPAGTRIEAFIGTTRCGVASLRRTGSFTGFSLSVAGPESIPACAIGGTISFRVNGRPAAETALNERDTSAHLDLTAR
jgi:alpha-beta hydrolase superfamily lysophospholipase